MNYSEKFAIELAKGKVLVRKIWENTRREGKFTVQFMQELEGLSTEGNLVAIANGIENKPRVTALFTFTGDTLSKRDLDVEAIKEAGAKGMTFCFDGDSTLEAKTLFNGVEVAVQVDENHTRNPYTETQLPKINPNTSEILTKDGKAIYRHTSLVPKESCNHTFMAHDTQGKVVSEASVSEEEAMLAKA